MYDMCSMYLYLSLLCKLFRAGTIWEAATVVGGVYGSSRLFFHAITLNNDLYNVCMYVCMTIIPPVRSITLDSAAALVIRSGCVCPYEVLEDGATSMAVEEDHSFESRSVGVSQPPFDVILSYIHANIHIFAICIIYVCRYHQNPLS